MENASIFIKNDIINILKSFVSQYNVRFTTFFQIWSDMKFYQIYCGKQHPKEKIVFIETVLAIASDFFLDISSFQIQIGSLYLLYCLYHCQNHQPKLKIRFTISHLNAMEQFMSKLIAQQHFDTLYILLKLFKDNAILFVHSAHEVDLHQNKCTVPDLKSQIMEDIHLKHALQKLNPAGGILAELHENYVAHSDKLTEVCPEVSSLINNYDREFISKYQGIINKGVKALEKEGSLQTDSGAKHVKESKRNRKRLHNSETETAD